MPAPFKVLYISNLDHLAYQDHLYQAFAPWQASIRSIRLIRDTSRPLGFAHAYVNFTNHKDAADALAATQPLFVNSSYCRVVPYTEPGAEKPPRPDPAGALYIKNLDLNVSVTLLYSVFRPYGPIVECRIAIDEMGMPRGFGFVTYENSGDAPAAIEALDGVRLGQRRIFVSPNVPRGQRGTKLFVRFDDAKGANEADLRATFGKLGALEYLSVPTTRGAGESRGFAFVIYRDPEHAQRAVDTITEVNGAPVTVTLAAHPYTFRRSKDVTNLYVRPLGDDITDETLAAEFGQFGRIVSTRVMRNEDGTSRGFGFVSFESAAEADAAAEALNGQERWGQELFVARAQGRRDRDRARRPWGPEMLPAGAAPLQGKSLMGTPLGMSPVMLPGQTPQLGGKVAPQFGTNVPGAYSQFVPMASAGSGLASAPALNGAPNGSPMGTPMGMPMGVPMTAVQQGPNGSEYYLVPMEYPYMVSPYAAVPTKEQFGESLHPRVLQHAAVRGDSELASQITGILLEQQPSALIQWLENEDVLDERIQQACDAYREWTSEKAGNGSSAQN